MVSRMPAPFSTTIGAAAMPVIGESSAPPLNRQRPAPLEAGDVIDLGDILVGPVEARSAAPPLEKDPFLTDLTQQLQGFSRSARVGLSLNPGIVALADAANPRPGDGDRGHVCGGVEPEVPHEGASHLAGQQRCGILADQGRI